MKYSGVTTGFFVARPNRFLARALVDGAEVLCHVKNTGRCRELLLPGARLVLTRHDDPKRRTAYSVVAVYKGDTLVNIDSQAPNQAAYEWAADGAGGLFGPVGLVKREQSYGNSRFDLYLEADGRRIFLEVKGVTLEQDGVARFPDAPTIRGLKHVEELAVCRRDGYEAALLFVVQMKGVRRLEPNWATHEAFGLALRRAREAGVRLLAYDCLVTEEGMKLHRPLPVCLDRPAGEDPGAQV